VKRSRVDSQIFQFRFTDQAVSQSKLIIYLVIGVGNGYYRDITADGFYNDRLTPINATCDLVRDNSTNTTNEVDVFVRVTDNSSTYGFECAVQSCSHTGTSCSSTAFSTGESFTGTESINAPKKAGPILEEADRIYSKLFDEPHFDQAATWVGLGYVAMHNGDYDTARALMDRALELRQANNGADNPGTVRTRNAIGRLEYERGNLDGAAEVLESALALYDAGNDSTHPFVAEASTWLGRVRLAQGAPDAAVALLEEAVKLGEAEHLPSHVDNVRRRLWLAEARVANGDETARSDANAARRELAGIEANWAAALAENPVPSPGALLDGAPGEAS